MKYFFTLIIIFSMTSVKSQTQNQKPCSAPEASQFDFWIGDWKLTWNDTSHGTNKIQKVMDGCTIQENFSDPASKYFGSSWSVYNPTTKLWQQTWVDNAGAYIALTGKFENNEMILITPPRMSKGVLTVFRMVFYNITPNAFDWRWESSTDNGTTWKPSWAIKYKRKS